MPDYSTLTPIVSGLPQESVSGVFAAQVIPTLVEIWLTDYRVRGASAEIVETTVENFSYLFDVGFERLIAAWGLSRGKQSGTRDKSRMAGHPLSAGADYHRGHAIPHTLGGLTDINLIPQLGRINVGEFRKLEIAAVETPGSLYFTYWMYGPGDGQVPIAVEQGLFVAGSPPRISRHSN